MKLALAQITPTLGNIEARLTDVRRIAQAASGADMVLFPELILPGYNQPALHHRLAQPLDGAWMDTLRTIARTARTGLAFGWAERDGQSVYNSATAIGADGEILSHYRKIQLFGPMENASFVSGTQPPALFDIAGHRAAMLICYDIEFPTHAANLAARGANLILVPTANPSGFEHVQDILVPARAYENRLTVAYANYCGKDAGISFGGQSVIAGPNARPIARAGQSETVLIVDVPDLQTYDPAYLSTQHVDLRRV